MSSMGRVTASRMVAGGFADRRVRARGIGSSGRAPEAEAVLSAQALVPVEAVAADHRTAFQNPAYSPFIAQLMADYFPFYSHKKDNVQSVSDGAASYRDVRQALIVARRGALPSVIV